MRFILGMFWTVKLDPRGQSDSLPILSCLNKTLTISFIFGLGRRYYQLSVVSTLKNVFIVLEEIVSSSHNFDVLPKIKFISILWQKYNLKQRKRSYYLFQSHRLECQPNYQCPLILLVDI